MNKLEISQDINFEGRVCRSIKVDEKLNLEVGQIYKFFHDVESWGDQYSEFIVENYNDIKYFFTCKNAKGHKVDYDNEAKCEVLDCEGMENESEVLIHKDVQKFRIVSILEGFEDVGYCEVELEVAE